MQKSTPETDAAQHEGLLRGNPMPTQVVHFLFARKLEQERDEAREKLRIASIEVNARQEIANILKERDEAREQNEVCQGIIDRTLIARNSALSELTDLERERDEARKETEYYKARYEQLKERPENPKWYNGREIPAQIKEETK